MSLAGFIDKITGSPAPPPVDLNANQDRRRALLARAQRAEHVPVPRDRHAEADEFVETMASSFDIEDLSNDEESVARIDAFIDAARVVRPAVLTRHLVDIMASWLGQLVRHEQGLRWTRDGTLTDGRIAYDPLSAIRARIRSRSEPTLTQSIRSMVQRADILTLAAS